MRPFVLVLVFVLAAILPARAQEPPASPDAKPAPRIMVLTFGRADDGELAPKVQGIAEEVLLDLRFPLVDESQATAHYELPELERILILTPEASRIAELKARFGAEMILVVQYTRRFQYEKEHYGATSRFFKNDVRVKAIFADTAEVVHSGGGEGPIEARQSGLEALVREHVRRAAERVLERRSYEAVAPSTYQIAARGIERQGLDKLESILRLIGKMDVVERDFRGAAGEESALIEVRFLGSLDELKSFIGANVMEPPVEITAATANRLEIQRAKAK